MKVHVRQLSCRPNVVFTKRELPCACASHLSRQEAQESCHKKRNIFKAALYLLVQTFAQEKNNNHNQGANIECRLFQVGSEACARNAIVFAI